MVLTTLNQRIIGVTNLSQTTSNAQQTQTKTAVAPSLSRPRRALMSSWFYTESQCRQFAEPSEKLLDRDTPTGGVFQFFCCECRQSFTFIPVPISVSHSKSYAPYHCGDRYSYLMQRQQDHSMRQYMVIQPPQQGQTTRLFFCDSFSK